MSELFADGGPTPPLEAARAALDADRHLWWVIGCGHHENLWDAALERIDELEAEMDRLKDELRIVRGIARLLEPEELAQHDAERREGP